MFNGAAVIIETERFGAKTHHSGVLEFDFMSMCREHAGLVPLEDRRLIDVMELCALIDAEEIDCVTRELHELHRHSRMSGSNYGGSCGGSEGGGGRGNRGASGHGCEEIGGKDVSWIIYCCLDSEDSVEMWPEW